METVTIPRPTRTSSECSDPDHPGPDRPGPDRSGPGVLRRALPTPDGSDHGDWYRGARVLVTGGMGFVGGHLVRRLAGLGASVTVLDLDCTPCRPSLVNDHTECLRSRVRLLEADVTDIAALRRAVADVDPDVVFHLAAYSVIERSAQHPIATIETNAMGVVNLLEALRSAPRLPSSIVVASTDKVYGEMDSHTYVEDSPLRGIGLYDAAKLAADVFSRTYHEAFGMPTVVLRLCNLFGPHDYNTDFRLIPKALTSIFGSDDPEPPVLYFDSIDHWRDYLYVTDAVEAFLLVGRRPDLHGQVFNLSATAHMATPEILKAVVEIAASQESTDDRVRAARIIGNGITVAVRAQQSGVVTISRQHLDGSKLIGAVGFTPTVSLQEGLSRTVEFYRSHHREVRLGEVQVGA